VIGWIRGTVVYQDDGDELVVEAAGVGYRVAVPNRGALADPVGQPIELFVHTVVREDAISLYGFESREDMVTFRALLATPSVGPSLALAVLGRYRPAEIEAIVLAEDVAALSQVSGVGAKTAARLLVELSDRRGQGRWGNYGPATMMVDEKSQELRSALAALGYSAQEVSSVLSKLAGRGVLGASRDIEELLRLSLRELSSRR
jgi:Holliday junction DNA helicase RuvA